jgi:hypothetical protein
MIKHESSSKPGRLNRDIMFGVKCVFYSITMCLKYLARFVELCAATLVTVCLTRPLLLSDFNHTQDVVKEFKKISLYNNS